MRNQTKSKTKNKNKQKTIVTYTVSLNLHYRPVIEFVIKKKRMDILEKELENIGVPFKFFQVQCEDGSSQTQWTRLDGKNAHC